MPRRPSHADRRAAAPAPPRLRRQGGLAGTPHRRLPFDPDHVGQARPRSGPPETRSCRRSRHPPRPAPAARPPPAASGSGPGPAATSAGTRRSSGTPAGAAAAPILRPALRQVQPIGDRETDRVVRQRHAHRHLAVVLFAQGAAVLAGHPDRVPALLGIRRCRRRSTRPPGRAGHRRQHPVSGDAQDGRLVPGGIGDEVLHRLVPRADMPRIDPGGHRLDALPLARQAQPGEVGAHRLVAIGVSQGHGQPLDVLTEPAGAGIRVCGPCRDAGMVPSRTP